MAEIVFHQYAMSPFSEKIRKVFALKNLEYREVDQPAWMPKPHLTPLTGGYRRIPVLQVGADVYCDTALIARKLDQLQPEPSIHPDGQVAAAEAIATWADRVLFFATVAPVFTSLAAVIPPELFDDRRRMFPQMTMQALEAAAPSARATVASACAMLEASLFSRPFLLGEAFSIADAAVYHALWFARSDAACAAAVRSRPCLASWFARVEAMGSGRPRPMGGDEALAIARASEPADIGQSVAGDPSGLAPGALVGVCADDLPTDVFTGTLAALREHEMVILREDPAVGRVAIHFPRAGYQLRAA